ncbi:helix-turn-helix domain-containing protein [Methylobacterium mesophilicum SR1.6/6]|uniref:Helix-turn-helix domain-containing protein n=1 Tax=Methylobacterium mesophilicum SR1.6/6 TaxID=908290 RepID=A0A6B9FJ16_9HYPH|nr:YdaS family helix-turn-helix protein [Methylobacterium mesophilicum]QGY02357.1 helix-turn-helix domain-containing protein [Methylobacterium mesophilicum SR1.6/6]
MAARPRFSSTAQAVRASAAMRRAIAVAGGAARLGHQLGLHAVSVNAWTFCPAQHINAVAVATGVARSDLRPDLFPRADTARPLTPDQAIAAHLAAGAHFARTGRCLSAEVA